MYENNVVQNNTEQNNEIWEKYKETHDINIRNDLIIKYSYIVKCIASQMRGMYKTFADMDDVVNHGIITLIEAIEKFDIDRGIKFETYASIRVKGAIIDFIRKQDWVPRRVRKTAKDIEDTISLLWTELGRKPTEEEIAEKLGISVDELHKNFSETYGFNMLSYEELVYEKLQDIERNSINTGESSSDLPGHDLQKRELKTVIAKSIDGLSEKERIVVSLYYYE